MNIIQVSEKEIMDQFSIEINSSELDFIKKIEAKIAKKIPIFQEKITSEIGYQVEKNHVIALRIQNIKINEIPNDIEKLTEIKELILSNTSLTNLPASIGKLEKLEILTIDSNNLKSLPDTLGQLRNLKKIWVDNNPLTKLPENIGQLKQLETLGLRYTPIKQFPASFRQLLNVKQIYVMENQISALRELTKSCSDLVIYSVKNSR